MMPSGAIRAYTGNLWLTLRTVKFLTIEQIFYRLWYRIYRPNVDLSAAPGRRALAHWQAPIGKPDSAYAGNKFIFLNRSQSNPEGINWEDPTQEKLWLYNLHYFDYLNSDLLSADKSFARHLIADWIHNNQPGTGVGWEPYPTSLRMVNWIKWCISSECTDPIILNSLAVQARWLAKNIEHHILANHLFTNAKALVFVGLFFKGNESERWLNKGILLINAELQEQILADGGHFERSPMYHDIILEDMLDLLNLASACPSTTTSKARSLWQSSIAGMLEWMTVMTHPDGEIAFFNDSAIGIARHPLELIDYAKRLKLNGVPRTSIGGESRFLEASGYVRLQTKSTAVLLDIAAVGPDYQPGHAHADTLSFEMSHNAERILVNSGTSTYLDGPLRHFQRSTSAHTTVEVNSENSSEVWAGFRVARRARVGKFPVVNTQAELAVTAHHDGYCRLHPPVTHQRQWSLTDERLMITDTLQGNFQTAIARFYLHPDVVVQPDLTLITRQGVMLRWQVDGGTAAVEPSIWYPQFGIAQDSQCIVVSLSGATLAFTMWFDAS